MHPLLNIAQKAARNAGDIIARFVDRIDTLQIEIKESNDFVTEVDRRAEQEIINVIHKAYPKHSILAEESGTSGEGDHVWIIDPLDGTTNFLHGFPHYAVSIALRRHDVLEHAVIYDPLRQEMFSASRGEGAQLNGRRIRVSKRQSINGTLLGTGFPFKNIHLLPAYMDMFKAFTPDSAGIRRAGSAALDLAYVASGRLDGFWEFGLKPWDLAAGVLMVQEAGGLVRDFNGGQEYFNHGNIIAGNLKICKAMQTIIKPIMADHDLSE